MLIRVCSTPIGGAKAPAKGAAGPSGDPPGAMGNVPSDATKGPGAPGAPAMGNMPGDPTMAGVPPMTTLGNTSTVGDPPMFVETDPSGVMRAVPAPAPPGSAPSGGKKADTKKSKDEIKTTGAAGGPPVVPTGATPMVGGGFMPLDHSGKDTRFSDTVGVGHAAGPHNHDDGDAHVHHGTSGSAPTTPTNKLKKAKPDAHGHATGGGEDRGTRSLPDVSGMDTPAPGPIIPDGSRPAIITPSGEIIPTGPPIHAPSPSMGASLPSTTAGGAPSVAGSAKGKKCKGGDAPVPLPDVSSIATPAPAGGISLEGARPAVITPAGEVIPTGPSMPTPAAQAPGGGDGGNKLKKGKGGSHDGGGVLPMASADFGSITHMPPPSLLEEVIMPDGSSAYIRKLPQPSIGPGQDADASSKSGKKGNAGGGGGGPGGGGGGGDGGMPGAPGAPGDFGSVRRLPSLPDTTPKPMGPHCSVCCPGNHKTAPGLPPTETCAHHDSASVAPSATGGKGKKGGATGPLHILGGLDGRSLPDVSGGIGGPAAVAAMEVPGEGAALAAVGGENKLKKGNKPGAGGFGGPPPGPLGLPMTPAEQAVEDVKKLASELCSIVGLSSWLMGFQRSRRQPRRWPVRGSIAMETTLS